MKTPMQELLEWARKFKPTPTMIEAKIVLMLEKEMAVIIEAFHEGMRCQGWDPNRGIAEEYYNETFNTKEK